MDRLLGSVDSSMEQRSSLVAALRAKLGVPSGVSGGAGAGGALGSSMPLPDPSPAAPDPPVTQQGQALDESLPGLSNVMAQLDRGLDARQKLIDALKAQLCQSAALPKRAPPGPPASMQPVLPDPVASPPAASAGFGGGASLPAASASTQLAPPISQLAPGPKRPRLAYDTAPAPPAPAPVTPAPAAVSPAPQVDSAAARKSFQAASGGSSASTGSSAQLAPMTPAPTAPMTPAPAEGFSARATAPTPMTAPQTPMTPAPAQFQAPAAPAPPPAQPPAMGGHAPPRPPPPPAGASPQELEKYRQECWRQYNEYCAIYQKYYNKKQDGGQSVGRPAGGKGASGPPPGISSEQQMAQIAAQLGPQQAAALMGQVSLHAKGAGKGKGVSVAPPNAAGGPCGAAGVQAMPRIRIGAQPARPVPPRVPQMDDIHSKLLGL
eukprot:TRINITY_DN29415_c0_g1_i1.p1 TRINITY_DN29415_c0_g1~~TRINITY_DN29415_c0_g1_i1.p1  ORF type:complete len:435 (+),score=102.81 TRINITY_DN29415_c0_g1_i1:220-1524(+)